MANSPQKGSVPVFSGSGWLADQLAQQGIAITAADWADYRQARDKKRGYPMRSVFRLDHHVKQLHCCQAISTWCCWSGQTSARRSANRSLTRCAPDRL